MRHAPKKNRTYHENETGGWKKKWTGKLPIALVFPNVYRVGMSNLGFQLVYDLVNTFPDVVCERVFLSDDNGQPPRSIESGRPLQDFPVILFSISFEQDYFNIVHLLRLSSIEPLVSNRNNDTFIAGEPLLIGGGVATFINPEPLAPFFDLFVIGDAEPVLPQIIGDLLQKIETSPKKMLLYEIAAAYSGCYAPGFYTYHYNDDGTLESVTAAEGLPARIKKNTVNRTVNAGHSQIVTPEAEFANIYLTELGRGCSRGCRFCAAGFVYRPPRLWNADAVIKALEERPEECNRIGLLGMEMAHKDDLEAIVEYLLSNSCELSFSSLRADCIDANLLRLLSGSNIKNVAIAPDGGSERLRRVINKGITEEDVLIAADALFRTDVKNLKLYFMIGLPTETIEDLEELVTLTLKVKDRMLKVGRKKGRLSQLTLSVNSFVPKPWTPFQYQPFMNVSELKGKIKFLKKKLGRVPNIKLMTDQPDKVLAQAILSRGDRRVGEALYTMATEKSWLHNFKQAGIDPEFYAYRQRGADEFFPWEIIDHGINKQYLWLEYQRALNEKFTPPCDTGTCKRCGVCL